MPARNDTHLRIIEALGDKQMDEGELAGLIGRPPYAVRAALRGMLTRKEVMVIRPKVPTGKLFKYKLRGK